MTDTTIKKSIFLNAPRGVVWDYLTKADMLAKWFRPADGDLEQGKDYTLIETENEEDGPKCWGHVEEARPVEYLRYSFTVGFMNGAMTTVIWTLEAVHNGTRLTLEHSGLSNAPDGFGLVLALDKGWHGYLTGLRETTD